MPKKLPPEASLCRDFIAWLKTEKATAYPETSDWDIVVVLADGTQIGIQAKKHFNAALLRQALPQRFRQDDYGPDYRAVLLPRWDREVWEVCQFCGLIYFHPEKHFRMPGDGYGRFQPELNPNKWPAWSPKQRLELPPYIPDVNAGASSPIRLTDWKIRALRICAMLALRGHVTRADFKRFGIDHRRWTAYGMEWLVIKDGVYIRGKKLKFDKQHPVVFKQILAELREMEAANA